MKNKILFLTILCCFKLTAPSVIRGSTKTAEKNKLLQAQECAGETIIGSMRAIAAAQKKLAQILEKIVNTGVFLAEGTPEKATLKNTPVEWEEFTDNLNKLNKLCEQLSKVKV